MSDRTAIDLTHRYSLTAVNTAVTFTTRHLFGLGTVMGSTQLLNGSVTVSHDDVPLIIEANLDAASFDSASSARDQVVASRRFLDTAAHPEIRFRSTHIDGGGSDWVVTGELTVRGVVAPVELHLTATEVDGVVSVSGTARVDRYAHGITAARGLAARYLDVVATATVTRADHV